MVGEHHLRMKYFRSQNFSSVTQLLSQGPLARWVL